MTRQPVLGVEITGYGIALPETVVTNKALIAELGFDQSDDSTILTSEHIERRTGITQRYIADSERDETNASLSVNSGHAALALAGLNPPYTVDKIFLATTTPDRRVPSTSAAIHNQLGLLNGGAIDVNAACAGFPYALHMAHWQIAAGGAERILVIGTDILSRITNWEDPKSAILFGDGSGALVLERKPDSMSGLLGYHEAVDGSLGGILYCNHNDGKLTMNGRAVYVNAVRMLVNASRKAMEHAGVSIDDIALVVPHQANKRIIEAAGDQLGVDRERAIVTIDRHANTSAASIPLALATSIDAGRVSRGDLILLAGFGAGMTVAASVLRY